MNARSMPKPSTENNAAVAAQRALGARIHPEGAGVRLQERDKPPQIVEAVVVSYHDRGLTPWYTLRLADGTTVKRCAQRVRKAVGPRAAPAPVMPGGRRCAVCGAPFVTLERRTSREKSRVTCGPKCAQEMRIQGRKRQNSEANDRARRARRGA